MVGKVICCGGGGEGAIEAGDGGCESVCEGGYHFCIDLCLLLICGDCR